MRLFDNWRTRRGPTPRPVQEAREANPVIDVRGLAAACDRALASRHRPDVSPFAYADGPSGPPTLLATTAAVNIRTILGKDLGTFAERAEWVSHINSFKLGALNRNRVQDPEHALCMAIQALNLLGAVPSLPAHCFASTKSAHVDSLISSHDWTSTHKSLWGKVAPLLASGLVDSDWQRRVLHAISGRLQDSIGIHFGIDRQTSGPRTISVLYHIGMIYDAAREPYPFGRQMADLLLDLNWPETRRSAHATFCSDADWAWMLTVLACQEPDIWPAAIEGVRKVAEARAAEWNAGETDLQNMSTHHIFCFLWSTARFQDLCRECFAGPFIPDTLNLPSLFRVRLDDATCEGVRG